VTDGYWWMFFRTIKGNVMTGATAALPSRLEKWPSGGEEPELRRLRAHR